MADSLDFPYKSTKCSNLKQKRVHFVVFSDPFSDMVNAMCVSRPASSVRFPLGQWPFSQLGEQVLFVSFGRAPAFRTFAIILAWKLKNMFSRRAGNSIRVCANIVIHSFDYRSFTHSLIRYSKTNCWPSRMHVDFFN